MSEFYFTWSLGWYWRWKPFFDKRVYRDGGSVTYCAGPVEIHKQIHWVT